MNSRSKVTLAGSLADDLEAALVQAQAQAGAAISFPDFLTSPEYAGPFNATVDASRSSSPGSPRARKCSLRLEGSCAAVTPTL